MEISINCHSSIKIKSDKTIYFDPFKIVSEDHDADIIFITHDHYDHFSIEDIKKIEKEDTVFVIPECMYNLLGGENVGQMDDDELADIRNRRIGFIFQQYNLLPKLSALENVELPLLYAGKSFKERRERALAAMERVEIADKADFLPNQLSGGQQQRISIARALAGNPSLILADEPTGALDSRTGREVLGYFKEINDAGNTVVLITHDNSIAMEANRIIRLLDGKIIYDGKPDDYEEFTKTLKED